MGFFSFGKSKSRSNSQSDASTYVDPSQQPYLNDIRRQAQQLNGQGMPVEGVAGINNNLRNTLSDQYAGGNMIANAGGAMGEFGNDMARQGYGGAMDYANRSMGSGPMQGAGFAFGAGNQYASGAQGFDAAQGGGAGFGMANAMGNSAFRAGQGYNSGADVGSARRYGNQAMMGSAASANGFNSGVVNQAGGLATQSAGSSNQGFNQGNLSNYINNDVLQGQIDASTRDITRNLQQNTLPSIQGQAAGSGNSGSSRVGNMMGTAMGMANESIGDISANMRGNAYNQAVGIEANRASQNAQMGQQNQQFNTSAINNMASQGLGIAGNQTSQNAGFNQQTNLANQNAFNNFTGQGFGIDASRANENAGYGQQANMYNAQAGNALLGQGFGIGASQLEANLGRQQQADQYNAGQFNQARQFGTGIGQGAFNSNTANNQFGADMAFRGGAAGVGMQQTGANMIGSGLNRAQASGQYGRDYEQQLYNQQFRQGMAPFNSLNFYNQIVGGPNNLSKSSTTTSGKSSSMQFAL